VSKPSRESHARDSAAEEVRSLYRRVPWLAVVTTLAVLFAAGCAVEPIRDAATLETVPEVFLSRPFGYVLLAPLSDSLDMLTLFSAQQHIAFMIGLIVLFAVWRTIRLVTSRGSLRSHLVAAAAFFVSLLILYAAAAVLPRPMAALVANDVNLLRADFHSHTSASHDGHGDSEHNRAWHRDGGYDVAYITDHYAVREAERAVALNPNPANEGVVLLQGIEVNWRGEHVAILGAERTYKGILTPDLHDVDEQALRLASLIPGREPVVIWNHPRHLDRPLPIASGSGTMGVRAIEIVNAAPADADRIRRNRSDIVALATKSRLALTTGSDNHGWGRTAPAWTLLHLPQWQNMTPDALAARIEASLRTNGVQSTRVVERRIAEPANAFVLGVTVIAAPARMLTTISNDERVSWIIWTWLIAIAAWLTRRRRPPPRSPSRVPTAVA
jgi:hypothetical protein